MSKSPWRSADKIVRAETNSVTGGISLQGQLLARQKIANIGRVPMTVSGIGNSIMVSGMNWIMHACQQSKGLLIAYDRCHGVAGNRTSQIYARVAEVPEAADIVFIQECTNDADGGVSAASHIADTISIIKFYLNRGQVPILCFPPARSDSTYLNALTFKFGMCDFFTAQDFGLPYVFPWRQFTNADATGALATSAGSSDGKHPGNVAHPLAGSAMLSQLFGNDHTLPLPVSSNKYNNIGLLSDALNLTAPTGWGLSSGSGGAMSQVTDAACVGSWLRITSNGGGDYQVQKAATYYGNVGDDLYCCYLARSSGTWASGFSQVTPMQTPSFGNGFGGYSYIPAVVAAGPIVGQSSQGNSKVVSGTTGVMMLAQMNAPTGNILDLAQVQIWNKSAILR